MDTAQNQGNTNGRVSATSAAVLCMCSFVSEYLYLLHFFLAVQGSRLTDKAYLRPMQTDATSHNIVSLTMLRVVGICCVVHANERNNCQHCWRLSKEAMHSGIVILKKDCNACA